MSSVYNKIINRAYTTFCEHKDFQTPYHIVVFESDDWGSIRMSNRKNWELLRQKGYSVDKRPYERFDTLESASDLAALFDVLSRHKGADGKYPIITANMLMANPDFDKIEKEGFRQYYYEPIKDTYNRYFGDTKAIEVMRQGMNAGVFMPQSHGREHFNVTRWIKGLQLCDEDLLTAFKYGMCGIAPKNKPEQGNMLMKSLFAESEEEQKYVEISLEDGLRMFEQMWGFKSQSFVAPCYCWNKRIEAILSLWGVKLIQTARANKESFQTSKRFFYTGKRNENDQIYSVRNCSFEPALNVHDNSVEDLIRQIDRVFRERKVVVFSSHRINFVSGIDEANRSKTLEILDIFLKKIIDKYPDTVFMSSDRLIKVLQ